MPKINKLKTQNETLAKLGGSFVGENVDKLDPSSIFNPPNITAFNYANYGQQGSLFNEANQRQTMDQQARSVENRVKILEKEEERMNKKIREAMRQAEKMDTIRQE